MKRKIASLLLLGIMAASMFGCGKDEGGIGGADGPTSIIVSSSSQSDTSQSGEIREAVSKEITTTPIEIAKSEYGNPIGGFNGEGALTYGGDPSVLVVGDTLYLYTGHDTATGNAYVIPEYQCYSTKDMVNWTYEGVVLNASM